MIFHGSRCMSLVVAVVLLATFTTTTFAEDAPNGLAAAEEKAIQDAVNAVADSIVQIQTVGGLEKVESVLTGTAPTSGVIVSEDGHIVCSSYSFVQKPSAVLVTLSSGQEFAAKIVARDKSRRLVLLKINTTKKLTLPKIVKRSELRVGQWAIAVGKSFDAQTPNVSVGIVSATERIWGRAVQTDAKVSPVNYGGALVDIYGQVIGILVPLSTEDGSQLAGAEMYDSGIGFAVPLNEIQHRLETMINGKELTPGLLGVTLKNEDLYRGALEVASTLPKSPARAAGIEPGDLILRIKDRDVTSHSQLKHALGPLYGGDEINITFERDKKEQTVSLTLADRIDPYEQPFVGILPSRHRDGTEIRFVYPDSPAAQAGLTEGDQLISLDGKSIDSAADWRSAIAALEPGQTATVEVIRGTRRRKAEIVLATTPEAIVDKLSPTGDAKSEETTIVDLSLPAEQNKCQAIIPKSYDEKRDYGLVVWLPSPKMESSDDLVKRWSAVCNERELIVLAPQPINADRWLPAEAALVRKFIDLAMTKYEIDPTRVVVHGYQAGGSLAHRIALSNRGIIRGVAVVDATVPRGADIRSNDPREPLTYYLVRCQESKYSKFMERDAKGLRALKFPVSDAELNESRYLVADEIESLTRWIDTLDRL